MDRRTGDAVQEEQVTTAGRDAAPAKEAAAPAVSGEPALPVKGNGGNDDHEREEEDEGYQTPTSPRHRLRAPEVCPPAPRARPVLMTAPRGRKRGRPEGASGGCLSDGVLTWVWVGADDLLAAFCRRRRVDGGKPGNVHVHW